MRNQKGEVKNEKGEMRNEKGLAQRLREGLERVSGRTGQNGP